jgi:hypothetical protein
MIRVIFSYARSTGDRVRGGRRHGWRLGAQARCLGHQRLIRLLLHGLGNEVKRFCSPTATETDGGRLMTVRWPGQTMVMVRATSGASPMIETLPTIAVGLGEALPSD